MTARRLTVDEQVELATVVALAACAGEVLSPFEAELIEEVRQRLAEWGDWAPVEAEEWRVVREVRPALQRRAREPA